jgi:hypothetical protein
MARRLATLLFAGLLGACGHTPEQKISNGTAAFATGAAIQLGGAVALTVAASQDCDSSGCDEAGYAMGAVFIGAVGTAALVAGIVSIARGKAQRAEEARERRRLDEQQPSSR